MTFSAPLSLSLWSRVPGLSVCHWLWLIATSIRALSSSLSSYVLCLYISNFIFSFLLYLLSSPPLLLSFLHLYLFISHISFLVVFLPLAIFIHLRWSRKNMWQENTLRQVHQSHLDIAYFHPLDWWLFNKLCLSVLVILHPKLVAACCIVLLCFYILDLWVRAQYCNNGTLTSGCQVSWKLDSREALIPATDLTPVQQQGAHTHTHTPSIVAFSTWLVSSSSVNSISKWFTSERLCCPGWKRHVFGL